MNLIAERNKKSLLSEADQQFLADNKAKFQNTKQNEAFAQFLAENPDYPTDSYERSVIDLRAAVSDLTTQQQNKEILSTQITINTDSMTTVDSDLQGLQNDLRQVSQELIGKQRHLGELQKQKDKVDGQLQGEQALEAEIAQLKTDLEGLKGATQGLEDALNVANGKLTEKNEIASGL